MASDSNIMRIGLWNSWEVENEDQVEDGGIVYGFVPGVAVVRTGGICNDLARYRADQVL